MATQTYEFKAKTVDDAVEEGLRALGLARSEVEIEILQKGSRGIFGLGSEPALVRLTPRPVATANPVPQSPVEAAPPAVEPPSAPVRITPDITAESTPVQAVPTLPPNVTPPTVAPPVVEPPAVAEPAVTDAVVATTTTDEDAIDQELMAMATHLLSEMVRLMGFTAEVRASWQDEDDEPVNDHDEDDDEEGQHRTGRYLLLDIEGVELGALIGRRGETLENIQYLLRLMVNQKIHKWKNIVVDVEHYKARRVTQLIQLAERMAEQVARTGRAISLEPMPANERRIVHMTLREHPDVYTESYGDGGRRKVHIFAKT